MEKVKKLIFNKVTVLGLFIALMLIYFGLSYYVASRVVRPERKPVSVSPQVFEVNYEDVTFTGADDVELKGWLLKSNESEDVIILVGGYGENRMHLSYQGLMLTKELLAQGFNVVLYDNRATGESGGEHITYGIKESQDLIRLVDYLKMKGYKAENMGIIGYSMGASSTLLALEELQGVAAIVSDSAAASFRPVIAHILKKEQGVPSFLHPGVFFIIRNIYGLELEENQPITSLASFPERELLFIHNEHDTSILPENSKLLHQTSNASRLVLFPEGKHIETYKMNPQLYRETVVSYLKQRL